jgi:hypothetical protein
MDATGDSSEPVETGAVSSSGDGSSGGSGGTSSSGGSGGGSSGASSSGVADSGSSGGSDASDAGSSTTSDGASDSDSSSDSGPDSVSDSPSGAEAGHMFACGPSAICNSATDFCSDFISSAGEDWSCVTPLSCSPLACNCLPQSGNHTSCTCSNVSGAFTDRCSYF